MADTSEVQTRHFCLCGSNLRSALITGSLCTLHSLIYLVLWIIEVCYIKDFKPFYALAITFYVLSTTAYILMIIGSVKMHKVLLIVSMTFNGLMVILGITTLIFNIKDGFQMEDALDQGNNILTWIFSIGVSAWATILGYGALQEIGMAKETEKNKVGVENPVSTNPFDEE